MYRQGGRRVKSTLRFCRRLPAMAVMLCAISPPIIAQEIPTPGQVQESLRAAPKVPKSSPDALVPAPAPIAATGVGAGGKTVLVERFDISGNKALSTEQLQAVVGPFQGRPLSLQQIYEVADAITHYYRAQGYTLAAANVPVRPAGMEK